MIYLRYFFTGYKTAEMSPFVLAVLNTLQTLGLIIIGSLVQGLYDNFSHGNYSLDFATIQGYIMPGVVIALGLINQLVRKYSNPAVSLKALDTRPMQGPASS